MDSATSGAFFSACKSGDTEALQRLLQQRAAPIESRDRTMTGLQWCCMLGHAAAVQVLLDAGADVAATDLNGWTALHLASRWGRLDCVHLLVKQVAVCDIGKTNRVGRNALMRAALRVRQLA